MEQETPKSACKCCGLSSPDEELSSSNSLLFGNIIDLEELDKARGRGCKFCLILAKLFRHTSPQHCTFARFQFKTSNGSTQLGSLSYQVDENEGKRKYDVFRPAGHKTDNWLYNKIQQGPEFTRSTSSEETFRRIRELFQQCELHGQCQKGDYSQSSTQGIWPGRLLDIRSNQVILREHCKPRKYACLSHCWGPPDNRPIITTRDTVALFRDGIPYEKLSTTFQHAVDICRRLSTDYIWIDSLCIIQDSAQDWKEESVKMGYIYQNAAFTIAATKSQDGNGGCYSTAEASIPLSEPVPGEKGVRVRPHHSFVFPSRFARSNETLTQRPLLSRGWVYQEMHLSRRILHFCHGEVVWQCRELTCQVDSGYRTENHDADAAVPRAVNATTGGWHGIVHNYSSLLLTYQSDRLPALAALAEQAMQLRGPGDRYLAGLWEKTLFLDLQWFRADTSADAGGIYKGKRVLSPRLPSWSWTSVDVRVMWKNHGLRPGDILSAVEIVSVDCEANGSAILGNYQTAQLVFRAPLLTSTLADLSNRHITDDRMGAGGQKCVEWFQSDYEHDAPGPGHIVRESMVFLMPLAVVENGIFSLCHCLVLLEKAEPGTRPCYERIGFARLEDLIQTDQFLKQTPVDGYFDDAKRRFEDFFSSLPKSEIALI